MNLLWFVLINIVYIIPPNSGYKYLVFYMSHQYHFDQCKFENEVIHNIYMILSYNNYIEWNMSNHDPYCLDIELVMNH
jgi:hypothetical protein